MGPDENPCWPVPTVQGTERAGVMGTEEKRPQIQKTPATPGDPFIIGGTPPGGWRAEGPQGRNETT